MSKPFSYSPFDDASGKQLLTFLASQGINVVVSGTFTANGTSAVTVAAPTILATSTVAISLKTVGGTVGAIPHVDTITPGTGFTVKATSGDTSIYNYKIIN